MAEDQKRSNTRNQIAGEGRHRARSEYKHLGCETLILCAFSKEKCLYMYQVHSDLGLRHLEKLS